MPSLTYANTVLYKDTLDFVRRYYLDSSFRHQFNNETLSNPKAVYKGRPLGVYLFLLGKMAPRYKSQTKLPLGKFDEVHKGQLFRLVKDFYNDAAHKELSNIVEHADSKVLSPEEHNEIEEIEKIPDEKKKEDAFEKWLEKKLKQDEKEAKEKEKTEEKEKEEEKKKELTAKEAEEEKKKALEAEKLKAAAAAREKVATNIAPTEEKKEEQPTAPTLETPVAPAPVTSVTPSSPTQPSNEQLKGILEQKPHIPAAAVEEKKVSIQEVRQTKPLPQTPTPVTPVKVENPALSPTPTPTPTPKVELPPVFVPPPVKTPKVVEKVQTPTGKDTVKESYEAAKKRREEEAVVAEIEANAPQEMVFEQPVQVVRQERREPAVVANLRSQGQILARKGITRGGSSVARMLGAGIRSGGSAASRVGLAVANVGLRGLAMIGGSVGAPVAGTMALVIIGLVLLLFALPIMMDLMKSTTPLVFPPGGEGTTITSGTGTSGGTTTYGSIAQCQFTRGDLGPNRSANYKSSQLLSYFEEAARASSVPPQVLAAIARVESPGATNLSDDELAGFAARCTQSPTGATGLMQIQPAGTTGFCRECVDRGAKLLGTTVDQLTRADYCDVRKSIYIGAGFLLQKLAYAGYSTPDGKWDPAWTSNPDAIYKMVNGFYGCLQYPSCNSGPFNYGTDVFQSVSACQPTTTTTPGASPGPGPEPSCNEAPPSGDLRQALIDRFGITMNGFDQTRLRYAWEKFCQLSSTKFNSLVRGSVINTTSPADSQQVGCPGSPVAVYLGAYQQEELFKVILTHELGHVIRNCSSRAASAWDQHLNALRAEGGLTGYSRQLCTYSNPGAWQRESEDFAEMIAYYLNPNANEQTTARCSSGPNPYTGGKNPLHFETARQILGDFR